MKTLSIKFEELSLDKENPRYSDIVENEYEGMSKMIENQKEKLLMLAKDIVKKGLNPSDLPMAIPDPENEELYIIVEGNRRYCTIMLLKNNDYLGGINNKKLKRKWEKFIKDENENIQKTLNDLTHINCAYFETREDARHWIKLKHARAHGGVGTENWKPLEIGRYESRSGKYAPSLQVINFLKKECHDETILAAISKDIKWSSTLDRLLGDPSMREFLGINSKGGILKGVNTKEEILKGLSKIVRDLSQKKINVNDLKSKKDRENYREGFDEDDIPKLIETDHWLLDESSTNKKVTKDSTMPDNENSNVASGTDDVTSENSNVTSENSDVTSKNSNVTSENSDVTSENSDVTSENSDVASENDVQSLKNNITKKRTKSPKNRKAIIPTRTILRISKTRIDRIYRELKSLDVEKFPNAASILARQFIEFSVNFYAEKKEISTDENSSLVQKIQLLAKHFKDNGSLTKDQLKPINTAVSNRNSLLAPNTLNSYVHNVYHNPSPSDLRTMWDNIEAFIKEIWK